MQWQDGFACLVHWFDRLLETRRGTSDAKLSIRCNADCQGFGNWCSSNPGNKRCGLGSSRADAYGTGLASHTSIADIDITTARGEIGPSRGTQCNVAAAGRVVD